MEKSRILGIMLIALIVIGGGISVLQSQTRSSPPLTGITIDPGHQAASTLLMVAKDKGFFASHGLNVTFIETPAAAAAVQNLLSRKTDYGFFNNYIISGPQLYNTSVRVIGTLFESDTNYVVARRDRGVTTVQDLEGKRIGVTKGSVREYFLDRFFILNGLSLRTVTVVDLPPSQLVDALANGDIDASFSPEPYVYRMRQKLGGNAAVWPTNLGQHQQYSLVCTAATLRERPEITEALLASVIEAEAYVNSHPDEAKKIARTQTNFDERYMDQDWQNHHFSVMLSQSLITSMEDETRWRIRNNVTNISEVPDFSWYIAPEILAGLNPLSVNLIQ